ncbi:NUDIX domain-containing protein [Austwickia chelonae]|uniref:NUDIX domain-containing protein n=1 Tax=Austwickia chelonae TaxID=100225 RepID=UPI000945AE44|nr:NUDIX domain-containing protein [Austwickia chelonae]
MESVRFALVPAVYVIFRRRLDGQRQVLLQLRQGTGFMDGHWACGAAGHVEAGESFFGAAVREAAEELGVVIREEDLVPLTVVHRRHEDDQPVNQRVDVYFACDQWEGEFSLQEAHRAAELRWCELSDLPEPVVPHEHRVFRALAEGELPQVLSWGFPSPGPTDD